jgi:GH15 family glucan-1,4-alpha-glucosidase
VVQHSSPLAPEQRGGCRRGRAARTFSRCALSTEPGAPEAARIDGYAALRSYAAIGDGRTLALVARDGSIDWLCAPEFDGPSVFGAILDAERGGQATVRPQDAFGVERRYVADTNVLETTFTTANGRLRVTDAMAIGDDAPRDLHTVIRRVECIAGSVEVEWSVAPRFAYGEHAPGVSRAGDGAFMVAASGTLRVHAFELGEPMLDHAGIHGLVHMEAGDRGLLTLVAGLVEPPDRSRDDFERMLEEATHWWSAWAGMIAYDGPWRPSIVRSGLALKLLVSATTGAIVAAGTTSLPEVLGGVRNWDYRYSWVRDSVLVLDAFFALGRDSEATAYFEWLRARLDPASGEVNVLYDIHGQACAPERELDLHGWRGSRPVRCGNSAADQFQQSTYGTLLHACHLYADRAHGGLEDEQRRTILQSAELLARMWAQPDAGIWEERTRARHHTHSKMMSAVGLHCAADLARRDRAGEHLAAKLGMASASAAAFVESRCVDPATGAYCRAAQSDSYDAAVLMPLGMGYARWSTHDRVERTIAVIREKLGDGGALLFRHRDDDGLPGQEGFFTPCSFWLAGALAYTGKLDEAAAVVEELIPLANDVGLFSEELAPDGAFLGNLPQALTHASHISAATAIADAESGRSGGGRPWSAG